MLSLGSKSKVVFASPSITLEKKYKIIKELYDRSTASLEIKVRILKAEVLETGLYRCVTWYPNAKHVNKLPTQHHRILLRCIEFRRKKDSSRMLSYEEALTTIK